MMPHRTCLLVLGVALAGCTAEPPTAPTAKTVPLRPPPQFEPAPRPFMHTSRRGGAIGALEVPIPPKMPIGTGAVPVGGGVARGSIVTGFREAF